MVHLLYINNNKNYLKLQKICGHVLNISRQYDHFLITFGEVIGDTQPANRQKSKSLWAVKWWCWYISKPFLFQIKMASRLLNTFAKRCPAALFIIVYEIHTSCVEPLRWCALTHYAWRIANWFRLLSSSNMYTRVPSKRTDNISDHNTFWYGFQ